MKKRMLVTTIALVLVIAVALTTSSLAWFTSSSSVTTGQVSFSAVSISGANLLLGDLGVTDLSLYDPDPVDLPVATTMYPAQGLPAIGALADHNVVDNKITLANNPFLKAEKVEQKEGFAVADQKVKLVTGGDYLAGGFNFANATGDALTNGVTVKATITLATVDADVAATGTTVNKGYIAYEGGQWKSAAVTDPAAAVFFAAKDVALLASIRIAMFGAANIKSGTTFGAATIWDFNGTGVVLTKNGYTVGAAGSNNQYHTTTGDGLEMPTESPYGTIDNHISMGEKGTDTYTFTFSQAFNAAIEAGNAGSIAYVMWMDGWDESALPSVSLGTFTMTFEVSASSVVG